MDVFWAVVAAVIVLALVVPMVARRRRARRRRALLRGLEVARGSRVVTMIHRQELMRVLGIPFGGMIDIDDAEQVLRAIRLTPDEMPIDLILHTPAVSCWPRSDRLRPQAPSGKVTVMVLHYAMSGGTLVALAADETSWTATPCWDRSIPSLAACPRLLARRVDPRRARGAQPQPRRPDPHSRRHVAQGDRPGTRHVRGLLFEAHGADGAERLAALLSHGRWTHDYPIRFDYAPRSACR